MPLQKIRFVLLDVDGVLTNGLLWIDSQGEEIKCFHVRDGLGIRLLQENGIPVGVITGRRSAALNHRLRELRISEIHDNTSSKIEAYELVKARHGLSDNEVAYMGDDLSDWPVLAKVGLSASPSDAVEEISCRVLYLAHHPGGGGAVRELAEFILKAQGKWPVP